MDPLEQIFLQSKAGSSGPGPSPQYEAFAQGQQNSLQRQKLALEAQQEARQKQEQDVLLPLKVAQYKQTQAMQSLSLQAQYQNNQDRLNAAKTATSLSAEVGRLIAKNDYAGAQSAVFGAGSTVVGFSGSPQEQAMMKQIDMAQNRYLELKKIENPKPTADESKISAMVKDLETAKGSPLTALERTQVRIAMESKGGNTVKTTDKNGNVVEMTMGGSGEALNNVLQNTGLTSKPPVMVTPAGTPTEAMKTKSQEQIKGNLEVLSVGRELLPLINPDTTGYLPSMKQKAANLAEQIHPWFGQFSSEEKVKADVLATKFGNDAANAMRQNDQLSAPEREKLVNAAINTTKDSSKSAKVKIQTVMRLSAEAARTAAKNAKQPIPEEVLYPDEIRDLYDQGEIGPTKARRLIQQSPFVNQAADKVEVLDAK